MSPAVPVLHSFGGGVKLYLDFNGDHEDSWGDFSDITVPAYDLDGDPTTFSSLELDNIQDIWSRVAEDYAPFNVDVTTEDPGVFDNGQGLHVVIGGDGSWTGGVNGGISSTGSFLDDRPNLVFVFSSNLGQGSPKLVADSISHEAGHSFGLDHQALYDDSGNLISEYNPGNSDRAPIMGDSYAGLRSVWWYGPTDESANDIQDDMAVIAAAVGYRSDDVGDSAGAATPLIGNSQRVTGAGIIGATDDLDAWSFTTGDGAILFMVNVPAGINNLDAKIELTDSSGNVVVSWQDPQGCDANLLATVAAGSYCVIVGSHGDYGDVGQYRLSGFIVPPPKPVNAPTDLSVVDVTPDQVNLTWIDHADNEMDYVVERSQDDATWQMIATLPPDTTWFVDSPLLPGSTYEYRVYAQGASGQSAFSNEASATTLIVTVPAPVGLSAAAVGSDKIQLAWADPSDNGMGYVVERTHDGISWNDVGTTPFQNTFFVDSGLNPGSYYIYRVRAVSMYGPSDYSNLADATTFPAPPLTPTDVTVTPLAFDQVQITWQDDAGDASGFVVEHSLDGTTWAAVATLPAGSTSYIDSGLAGSTSYQYRVTAVRGGLSSPPSDPVAGTTLPAPPLAPTGLQAKAAASNSIRLTWADNASDETGYVVERSLDGQNWSKVATLAANAVSYTNTGLSANKLYRFRVYALKDALLSAFSNTAQAQTLPLSPSAPTGLKASSVSTTAVLLSWTDTSANETGFKVLRSTDGVHWTVVATAPANSKSIKAPKPPRGQTYYYAIVATNKGGDSAKSLPVAIKYYTLTARAAPLPAK